MQYLQQAPADSLVYMISGYAVIFGGMLIYLISLLVRRQKFMRELEMLEKAKRDRVGRNLT